MQPIEPPEPTALRYGNTSEREPRGYGVTSVDNLGSRIAPVGENAVTGGAICGSGMSDEYMLWEGSPTPLLLVGLSIRWVLVLLVGSVLAFAFQGWLWTALLPVLAAIHLGYRYFHLKSIRYLLSSQRLEVTEGTWNQRKTTYEVYQLGAMQIDAPLLLRLFHYGHLTIDPPGITLVGIRNPEGIRDQLRHAGETEAARWDKVRLR